MNEKLFEQAENENKKTEATEIKAEENTAETTEVEVKDGKDDKADKRQERADFFKAKQELDNEKKNLAETKKALAEKEKQYAELEKKKAEYEKGLGEMGYKGEDAMFRAVAEHTGKSPEEVKAEWDKRNSDIEEAVKNHPAVKEAEELKAKLLAEKEQQEAMTIRNADLIAVKTKYPNEKAEDVGDFGEEFAGLRRAGFDAVRAYELLHLNEKQETKKPVSTGSTQGGSNGAEYYTMDEIKAMTPDEMHKNYSKVEKSLKKINQRK